MTEFADVLNDCLEQMAVGRSIDDCLKRYPEHADALRRMLETRQMLSFVQVEQDEVRQAQERVRVHLFAQFDRPRSNSKQQTYWQRWVAMAAAVMAFFVVGFTAQASLPGDPLYGVKRFTEQVQLLVVPDDTLQEAFNQRRIDEARQLMRRGRAASVEFEGIVEHIAAGYWVIAGLSVHITDNIAAVPIGTMVQVTGITTTTGELQAVEILLPAEASHAPSDKLDVDTTLTPSVVPSSTAPLIPDGISTQVPNTVPDLPLPSVQPPPDTNALPDVVSTVSAPPLQPPDISTPLGSDLEG